MVYGDEVKRRMVALVADGESPESLGRRFDPSPQTIRRWVRQSASAPDVGQSAGSNVEAASAVVEFLEGAGRLVDVDGTRVRHLLTLARAVDDNPASPGLHQEYRTVYERLVADGADSGVPDGVPDWMRS